MKRILILFLIITGLYIVFNNSIQFNIFSSNKETVQAVDTQDIDQINVDVTSVNTTIIPEDIDNVKVVYKGKQKLSVKTNGDTVNISLHHLGFNFFNWSPFSEGKNLKIYIPKNFDHSMDVQLGSGNLNFAGESTSNPMKLDELSVDIGSGNVNLRNMEMNKFKHNGASGNVQINSFSAKKGSFDLASGNLSIQHYKGGVDAEVSSGRLNLQMDQLTDDVKVDVTSGNVNIDLPKDASFKLDSEVTSGNLSCDFPLESSKSSKRSLSGTYGSGEHEVSLDITSGNVRIY